jgi:hypothetical protein
MWGKTNGVVKFFNHNAQAFFTHRRLLPVLAQSPAFPPVFSRTQLNGLDWKSDSRQVRVFSGRNALKLAALRSAELLGVSEIRYTSTSVMIYTFLIGHTSTNITRSAQILQIFCNAL